MHTFFMKKSVYIYESIKHYETRSVIEKYIWSTNKKLLHKCGHIFLLQKVIVNKKFKKMATFL